MHTPLVTGWSGREMAPRDRLTMLATSVEIRVGSRKARVEIRDGLHDPRVFVFDCERGGGDAIAVWEEPVPAPPFFPTTPDET